MRVKVLTIVGRKKLPANVLDISGAETLELFLGDSAGNGYACRLVYHQSYADSIDKAFSRMLAVPVVPVMPVEFTTA